MTAFHWVNKVTLVVIVSKTHRNINVIYGILIETTCAVKKDVIIDLNCIKRRGTKKRNTKYTSVDSNVHIKTNKRW